MADLFEIIRTQVLQALRVTVADLPQDVADLVEVTPPRDPAHGDMATNAAMVAARAAKQPPAKLAAAIAERLRAVPEIEEATAAGPGFINLRLNQDALHGVLPVILTNGEAYGDSTVGAGAKVNVEYVSANPTGPIHVGHCRGAVVGDALASLLARAGFDVTREFYINDAGAQVAALAWAAYWRYLQSIDSPLTEVQFAEEVPGGLQYRGDYLIPVGEELARIHGPALATADRRVAAPEVWFDTVRDFTIDAMMRAMKDDLAALGIRQDVFSSERALVEAGAPDRLIERLREEDLVYQGTLEPPKGKLPDDWEPRPQTLFRSTKFGDDVDRPLRKSDGSNTYFASDIAYHAGKIARGFTHLIDVLGADHGGYVPRIRAAVRAVSHDTASLEVVLCQIVRIVRAGQVVRMSKRAGTFETLRDLLDEVGKDAVRFTMLTRKPDAQMEFDLDQVVAQTRDNPVFYVQYAHARCRSVLRAAEAMFGADSVNDAQLAEANLALLTAPPDLAVIRRMAWWPRLVQGAALAREPHRIAFFLYDLASDFHMLWNRGKDDSTLRFLQADKLAETRARLALVAATAVVIRSGLKILGVTPVEEMR